MEVEYSTRMLHVNDSLMSEVEKLAKEGWQLVPGVQPVAIYNLVRQKHMPAQVAPAMAQANPLGTLSIDDSKVTMYRNGKPI